MEGDALFKTTHAKLNDDGIRACQAWPLGVANANSSKRPCVAFGKTVGTAVNVTSLDFTSTV